MAEEEINYASVVFKTKTQPQTEAQKEEDTVYDEVKVPNETPKQAADMNGFLSDMKATNRRHRYQLLACCLGTFFVILLLGIIAVGVFQSRITTLTAEIQKLTAKNNELNTQNQELKTQKNNFAEQIRKLSENSVDQEHQKIDAYCPKENNNNRQCKACMKGWLHDQSSCYAINNAKPPDQKTWEEARDNCTGKFSDLAVIVNKDEKKFISDNSWFSQGVKGYWIGLKVEDGRWKWTDGSDLTESSWIQLPTNGHCAISVQNEGWKSVSCGDKNGWICKNKALSV